MRATPPKLELAIEIVETLRSTNTTTRKAAKTKAFVKTREHRHLRRKAHIEERFEARAELTF